MIEVTSDVILENLFDGVYFVDKDRCITIWNKGAERITGFEKKEVIGRRCADNILRHIDADGRELCLSGCPLAATLADGSVREADVYLHHKQGHRLPVSVRISAVRNSAGEIIGGMEVFTDNLNSMRLMKELELLKLEAYLDSLTGIGNRRYADITLQTRILEQQNHNISFGLIFLDIDHFKIFNDTYGHKTGDDVLIMVGKTIAGLLRSTDIVARWGGEEFIILLPAINPTLLKSISQRVRLFIQRSYLMVGTTKLSVTASLGATLGIPGDTPESVTRRADSLMYVSKMSGRNRVTIG
ncbi:sensor domain-containing diguanylate cyclase [Pelotalea chapellei]|uniref:Diguanylate cyclase n=1 Tax=Pelotalea chapellei TaxID=44671 RepID=A0ABS5UAU9_9BACT|nr:sensor domain-containing diguanylate cyclase [Pelotalea chapellei]MBT1072814.1 diguanylate cyclase [Pelotalea chapellei]